MSGVQLVLRRISGPLPTSSFDAIADNSIVGFTQLRHRPSCAAVYPPECANHVYYEVAPQARGRGYGKQILARIKDEARVRGMDEIHVTCLSSNPASRRIIESNGGRLVFVHTPEDEGDYLKFTITL